MCCGAGSQPGRRGVLRHTGAVLPQGLPALDRRDDPPARPACGADRGGGGPARGRDQTTATTGGATAGHPQESAGIARRAARLEHPRRRRAQMFRVSRHFCPCINRTYHNPRHYHQSNHLSLINRCHFLRASPFNTNTPVRPTPGSYRADQEQTAQPDCIPADRAQRYCHGRTGEGNRPRLSPRWPGELRVPRRTCPN